MIKEKDAKITELESQIAVQQNSIDKLIISWDNNQQYVRRSCLKIHGILTPEDITATLNKMLSRNEFNFKIRKHRSRP